MKRYRAASGNVLNKDFTGGTKSQQKATESAKLQRELDALLKVKKEFLAKFPEFTGAFARSVDAMRDAIAEAGPELGKLLFDTEKTIAAMSRLERAAPGSTGGVTPGVTGRPAESLPGDIRGAKDIPAIESVLAALQLTGAEMLFLAENSKVLSKVLADIGKSENPPLEKVRSNIQKLMVAFARMAELRSPFDSVLEGSKELKRSVAETNTILSRMRDNLDAIGKGQVELQRNKFQAVIDKINSSADRYDEGGDLSKKDQAALTAAKNDLAEFNSLQRQIGVSTVENTLKTETAQFIEGVRRFQAEAQALQAAIPSFSPENATKARAAIKAQFESLQQDAAKFGEDAGRNVGPAAQPFIDRIEAAMVAAGDSIGMKVGAAFGNAMLRGLASAAPGLQGLASGAFPSLFGADIKEGGTPTDNQVQTNLETASGLSNVAAKASQAGEAMAALNRQFSLAGSASAPALKKLSDSAKTTANEIQGFFESSFGTLEDALVEFVTTGEFDFKKFINAIIADLARLVIRMLIIKPLMSFFGGLFGFGFASGGLVGTDGTVKKYASGGAVSGSGGTTSDNQLIMASRGEYVLNAAATRRVGASYLDRLNGGGSPSTERRKVGSSTINFAPQITVVNDGGSDKDGQQQGEQIGTMVRQSFIELLMKETRPGGMLESVNRKGFA